MATDLIPVLSIDFDFWVQCPKEFFPSSSVEGGNAGLDEWKRRVVDAAAFGTDLRRQVRMASTELPNPSRFFGFLDHKNYRFKPNSVRVMDQHHKAFHHLRREKPSWLIHVDAHHDLGYPRHEKLRSEHNWDVLDSGNWVRKLVEAGSLGKLTLIYPHWRRRLSFQSSVENAEHVKNLLLLKERGVEVEVLYGLDNLPDDLHVHATAICRSSAWTPPWLDDDFNSLVQSFRKVGSNALEETGRRRFDYDALTQHVSVIRCIKRPLIDAVHALPLPLASS